MELNIILFGQLKDILKNESIIINDVIDTNELQKELQQKYPALANAKYMIAVNKKVVHENISLNKNSEIALLPPFSGG